jgi:hypothetical protein
MYQLEYNWVKGKNSFLLRFLSYRPSMNWIKSTIFWEAMWFTQSIDANVNLINKLSQGSSRNKVYPCWPIRPIKLILRVNCNILHSFLCVAY